MIERVLPLGVDLGEARVRVAALADGGEYIRLLAVGAADVTAGVESALIEALAQVDVRETRAVTMIRSSQARLWATNFPKMSRRELDRACHYESVAALGGEKDVIVRIMRDESSVACRTIIAAAARPAVRQTVSALRSAGLRPVRIHHEGCALAGTSQGAVLDIGLRRSTLVVRSSVIPFVKTIELGGAHFTEELAAAHGTSFESAELRKRTIGLGGFGTAVLGKFSSAVLAAIGEAKVHGCDEIRELWTVGNGSRLDELHPFLESAIGIPMRFGRLTELVRCDLPAQTERWSHADWFGAVAASLSIVQRGRAVA